MDAIRGWIDYFAQGGRLIYRDLSHLDFRGNPAGILLVLVIVGIFTVALYANMQETTNVTEGLKNYATGARDDDVAHKKDAPPIPPPTEILSLRVYPIKSCRGFEVDSTRLKRMGLTLDRNWMFIDKAERKFLTIRSDPSMTLIDTAIVPNPAKGKDGERLLEISIHGTDSRVAIPAFPSQAWLKANTTLSTVEIWERETDAWEYGESVNAIFSEYFAKPVALVYKGPTIRPVAVNGREELYGSETPHHFADVMSLQIASQASLRDLNARLGHGAESAEALSIERFRPNIIVRGRDAHPWEEDSWKRIRITTTLPHEEALYKLDLDVVARCARCQVPNVDPATGGKDAKQPWEELMRFRRVDAGGVARWKPCFGMLCLPRNEGVVAVGARVEVLETTRRHLYNERGFGEL